MYQKRPFPFVNRMIPYIVAFYDAHCFYRIQIVRSVLKISSTIFLDTLDAAKYSFVEHFSESDTPCDTKFRMDFTKWHEISKRHRTSS